MLTMSSNGEAVAAFVLRQRGEYAEVMVRYGAHSSKPPGWWGTLLVDSSYGVYGYHWSNTGCPFPQYLAELTDTDYLLGKISRREQQAELLLRSVKEQVLRLRRERYITKDQAQHAWNACFDMEHEEYHPEVMIHHLVDAMPGAFDWTELNDSDWPSDAQQFVAKLWPLIQATMKTLGG